VTVPRIALLIGLVLLVALVIPTTAHGDFLISNFNSTLILTDHPNFYHALADEPTAIFPTGLSGGPYGPLFYYPTAAWLGALDKVHLIDVHAWSGSSTAGIESLPTILALKLPNLAVYLLVAAVIARTLRGERGEIAAWFWLANPAVIVFTLMMGQNDGWTALASVAALFFGLSALERQPMTVKGHRVPAELLAVLALAAGAAIKLSPILLVLPFAWVLGETYRKKALLAACGVSAFVVSISPFLGTRYFWDYGLFGRQAGKATDLPTWGVVLLYLGFLGLLLRLERKDADRARVLLFSFLAFHALFFLAGGWSPQRGVLFIAALSLGLAVRRWFLLPYLLSTAFMLLLALEHNNEIATGLFEPLAARVLLIPSLIPGHRPETVHRLLLGLSVFGWLVALPTLWYARRPTPEQLRHLAPVPFLLLATLITYFFISSSQLSRGVEAAPYRQPAEPQAVAAHDRFSIFIISPSDDLRTITFWLESGGGLAAIEVADGAGRPLYVDSTHRLVAGANRIIVGHVANSAHQPFLLTVTPSSSVLMRMVHVPPQLVLSSATLNGSLLAGTAEFSIHYQTTWGSLLGEAGSRLRHEWRTLAVSFVLCVAAFAATWLVMTRAKAVSQS
jgi:hypothetical protein